VHFEGSHPGANDTPGADTINFNLFGTGVHTISPNTGLPNITDQVTINGYSQPGASVNTLAKGTNAKLMIQLYGAKILDESGGLYINAPDVVVRGLVINGFDHGIWVSSGAANTKIVGNFVGTDPAGTQAPGNYTGVTISDNSGVASNTVGGSTPASRNLISGNVYCGVCVSFGGNEVSGNLIGTQRDGKSPLGNSGDGVGVRSSDNIVGRAALGYANTIAFNGGDGVMINGSNTVSNSILSNSIFSNGSLGIDLVDAGITPNDSGDADTGANNLQNYPVITSAKKASGQTTIKGKLNSTPKIPSRSSSSRTPRLQTGARRS
jgi:trimeric autotransporter adhesin